MIPQIKTNPPFLFNAMKHHVQWAGELFTSFRKSDMDGLLELFGLGSNLLCDYYLGHMRVDEIVKELTRYLAENDVNTKISYVKWIDSSSGKFKNVDLSDGSRWTFLIGDDRFSYVHIHPARYSKHSLRVRFLAFKTVVLLKLLHNPQTPDISEINDVRKNYLKASPIKEDGNLSHITRIYEVFDKLPVARI